MQRRSLVYYIHSKPQTSQPWQLHMTKQRRPEEAHAPRHLRRTSEQRNDLIFTQMGNGPRVSGLHARMQTV